MTRTVIAENGDKIIQKFYPGDGFLAAQWMIVKIIKKPKTSDRMAWYRTAKR